MSTLLSLDNAELAYGLHPLLDRASLTVTRGERIGLIGRNGTGKSSLLRLIAGLVPQAAGTLSFGHSENIPAQLHLIAHQDAMKTAMKASRKIRIPPATGSTMGMSGTIFSTASASWASCCGVGADMWVPWASDLSVMPILPKRGGSIVFLHGR